jgi:hypothetical protein
MEISCKKAFNHCAFVSVGLFFTLAILLMTAVLIQFFEHDPDSLEMHVSVSCHALAGIIFIVLNILHLKLNWQSMKIYVKERSSISKEAIYATLSIILFIVLGTFIVYLILEQ